MSGYTKICVRLNDYEINYGKIHIKALVQGGKAGPRSTGKESSCKLWAWLPLRATGIQSSTHLRSSTEEWESWSIYPPTSTWTPWSLCVGPPCSQAKKPAGIFTRLSAGVLWGRAEELWVEYQWHLLHYASPFSIAQYLGKYQRKWPMLLFSLPLKVSGHFNAPCIAFLPGLPVPM